jgi:serine/threonine-protein kinase
LSSFISLRDGLEFHGPLQGIELYHLALSLVSCVHTLHQEQIYHGSISPDSVALSADGAVKLSAAGDDIARETLPEYIAPEVLTGKRVSASSDIYQLGLLLHEAAICESPFAFVEISAKVSSIHKSNPYTKAVPGNKKMAAIIAKCYQKDCHF